MKNPIYSINHTGKGKYHLMLDSEPLCKTNALILFTRTCDAKIIDGELFEIENTMGGTITKHNFAYSNDYCSICLKKALKKSEL